MRAWLRRTPAVCTPLVAAPPIALVANLTALVNARIYESVNTIRARKSDLTATLNG